MPPAFNPDGVFWDVISIGFTPGASAPLSHRSFWLQGFCGSAPLRDSLGRPPWLVSPPTILSTASARFGSGQGPAFGECSVAGGDTDHGGGVCSAASTLDIYWRQKPPGASAPLSHQWFWLWVLIRSDSGGFQFLMSYV
ncbi:Uncharacterised protein [Sphingobacterium daejeonense]|nr:Uncharacterised protein [Sphingobacterium daejeonense]